jgi:hypothetical protein
MVDPQKPAGGGAQIPVQAGFGGDNSAEFGPLGRVQLVGAVDQLGELGDEPLTSSRVRRGRDVAVVAPSPSASSWSGPASPARESGTRYTTNSGGPLVDSKADSSTLPVNGERVTAHRTTAPALTRAPEGVAVR